MRTTNELADSRDVELDAEGARMIRQRYYGLKNEFVWYPAKGYGYLEPWEECTKSFHKEYRKRDATTVGKAITKARVGLVERFPYGYGALVDIGIGGGAFVDAMWCWGFDIDEDAIAWLRDRKDGALWDPLKLKPVALSFWDSFEHIPDAFDMLDQVEDRGSGAYVYMSIPIFESAEHALKSKHFKPNEHIWYFTEWGLRGMLQEHGFEMIYRSRMEEAFGREDIGTYVFERVARGSEAASPGGGT